MQLTILFDDPYYVGLLEIEREGLLYAARHIFGADPSDQEVFEFVRRDLLPLQARMTVGIPVEAGTMKRVNPKRMQREVRRQVAQQGISSKAHEAMRAQIEQNKVERHQITREQREAQKLHKREVARLKARERHRGR